LRVIKDSEVYRHGLLTLAVQNRLVID